MKSNQRLAWGISPHTGGNKIAVRTKDVVQRRLQTHFELLGHHKPFRLNVRFHGALCYIDAFKQPDPGPSPEWVSYWESSGYSLDEAKAAYRQDPTHLGRLRHFDLDRWSYAFFTYSNERYEPTTLGTDWFGTPEQALEIGCMYLVGRD